MKRLGLSLCGGALLSVAAAMVSTVSYAEPAFSIKNKASPNEKVTSVEDVMKNQQSEFYDLEKRKYDLIEEAARSAYLDNYWLEKSTAEKKPVEEVRTEYFKKNVKVSDKEVKQALEQFKDHPQLSKLPKDQQEQQIRQYLEDRSQRKLIEDIVTAALNKGELKVLYPAPAEPVYNVGVSSTDHVRYSAEGNYTKPVGCSGDDCLITVIEYSEFQCPFCSKVLDDTKKIITEYKGKIRWVVRDFPLSFHDRARPAAIAAHCAGKQGKFWEMYNGLFATQQDLSDKKLKATAEKAGVKVADWEACVKAPAAVEASIDKNFTSGTSLGVSGTPAFFINGRKLSGALPYGEFKRVIEDEIKKNSEKKPAKKA